MFEQKEGKLEYLSHLDFFEISNLHLNNNSIFSTNEIMVLGSIKIEIMVM